MVTSAGQLVQKVSRATCGQSLNAAVDDAILMALQIYAQLVARWPLHVILISFLVKLCCACDQMPRRPPSTYKARVMRAACQTSALLLLAFAAYLLLDSHRTWPNTSKVARQNGHELRRYKILPCACTGT